MFPTLSPPSSISKSFENISLSENKNKIKVHSFTHFIVLSSLNNQKNMFAKR